MPTFQDESWFEYEKEDYGTYVIEIVLNEIPEGNSKFERHGFIRFWLRNASRPTMADEMLYVHARPTCHALLKSEESTNILCPVCGYPLEGEVGESMVFKSSLQKVAEQLAAFWRNLNGDASILLRRSKASTKDQHLALDKTADIKDVLKATENVRFKNEDALYTKSRLEKDLVGGGDLVKRIYAFITQ